MPKPAESFQLKKRPDDIYTPGQGMPDSEPRNDLLIKIRNAVVVALAVLREYREKRERQKNSIDV